MGLTKIHLLFQFLPSFAAIHHDSHDTYMTPFCHLRNRCDVDLFTPVDRLVLRSVLDQR